MTNSLFYNHVDETELNKPIIAQIEEFTNLNPEFQLYVITSPLGEKYNYEYESNFFVIY